MNQNCGMANKWSSLIILNKIRELSVLYDLKKIQITNQWREKLLTLSTILLQQMRYTVPAKHYEGVLISP